MMVLSGMSSMEQLLDNTEFMRDFRPLDQRERDAVAAAVGIINDSIAIPLHGMPLTAWKGVRSGSPSPTASRSTTADRQSVNHIFSTSQAYYDNLTQTHGRASECIGCRKCERICPQHLPIVDDLKRVAETFEKTR